MRFEFLPLVGLLVLAGCGLLPFGSNEQLGQLAITESGQSCGGYPCPRPFNVSLNGLREAVPLKIGEAMTIQGLSSESELELWLLPLLEGRAATREGDGVLIATMPANDGKINFVSNLDSSYQGNGRMISVVPGKGYQFLVGANGRYMGLTFVVTQ